MRTIPGSVSRDPLEREKRRSSAILTLVMAISLGLVVLQVAPVLWKLHSQKEAFHGDLQQIAGKATLAQWHDRAIVAQVVQAASERDFELRPADIQVRRPRGRPDVTIAVSYGRAERFPGGYLHDFRFRSQANGTGGL